MLHFLSVVKLSQEYSADKSCFEDIPKIKKKLRQMRNEDYIIGKGWYPKVKNQERHTFYFDIPMVFLF